MKIVFTGGMTGGHFYPIIAIAESLHDIVREKYLVAPQLYYIAPTPFDERALFENSIVFLKSPAGKIRRYFSIRNITDLPLTFIGFFISLIHLFRVYPDVLISKGGYASVPTVLAAAVLGIPIIIHESDAKPGRANLFAARFATRIATSFDSAGEYFPEKTRSKVARTGTPIRKALLIPAPEDARELLGIDASVPTVLILGGSQGSEKINTIVLEALPDLVSFVNIIHQTGADNFENTQEIAKIALEEHSHTTRYHPFAYLSIDSLRQAGGISALVVSRAGAGSIAEIAAWKLPALLIPIPEAVSHDQRLNAYAFARTGAATVLEEENLTPHLFVSEIRRIVTDVALTKKMGESGSSFSDPDAASLIATAALSIALSHE